MGKQFRDNNSSLQFSQLAANMLNSTTEKFRNLNDAASWRDCFGQYSSQSGQRSDRTLRGRNSVHMVKYPQPDGVLNGNDVTTLLQSFSEADQQAMLDVWYKFHTNFWAANAFYDDSGNIDNQGHNINFLAPCPSARLDSFDELLANVVVDPQSDKPLYHPFSMQVNGVWKPNQTAHGNWLNVLITQPQNRNNALMYGRTYYDASPAVRGVDPQSERDKCIATLQAFEIVKPNGGSFMNDLRNHLMWATDHVFR